MILVDFQIDQFSIRKNNEGEKIFPKTLVSFSFEAVKPLQRQSEKPVKKNTKMLSPQSALLKDADVTDNDDQIEKRIPRGDDFLNELSFKEIVHEQTTKISLINNPSISGKKIEYEDENLREQTSLEPYLSVTEQILKYTFFDKTIYQKHI